MKYYYENSFKNYIMYMKNKLMLLKFLVLKGIF